jgi:DNA-binding NarL/FixJ family response regulator
MQTCISRAMRGAYLLSIMQATQTHPFSAAIRDGDAAMSDNAVKMGTRKLKIVVADDHDIIRRGLKQLLLARPAWEICGEAKTGREAVTLCEELKPDVVVMDISMPELNGLDAARQIRKSSPNTGILILTMHFTDQLVREVVECGARGYILKSDADKDLVSAVEALANRRTYFTREASEILLNGFSKPDVVLDSKASARNRLTVREREIVQQLAEGKSSKEVAVALGISVKTAETHRANIMRKLELHSVSELVRYAIRNQIIEA